MAALGLITLVTPACSKKDPEAKPTDRRFRLIFKMNSTGGAAVDANWGISTTATDLFNNKFIDQGKSGPTGMATTSQLAPGKYQIIAWGKMNEDSVGGFSSDNEIIERAEPKELYIFMH